jgi:FkbM family methyltransferase
MDFYFDTTSDGAARVYIHPYVEYIIHRFVKEWVTDGSICFDVGSQIGFYPLLCSFMGAKVFSFEANPEMVRMQTINVLLNNFQNQVTINPVAVSDRDGHAIFYCQPNGWSGLSSLYKDDLNPGTKIEVKTITLDSYIQQNGIDKVDLLKIDIEGAEGMALRGLQDSLSRGQIRTIIWESNYRASKDERLDTANMLSTYGFENYGFDKKTKQFRSWAWGDDDCISTHKSVADEFAKFIESVEQNFAVL